MANIIKNCELTHEDSTILRGWIMSRNIKTQHTGIDVSGSNVYSLCFGAVIAVGKDEDGYAVTVQYDESKCVRYCHLKTVFVKLGKPIIFGQQIGTCNKYIHLEYCISNKVAPELTVRVADVTFYKMNPTSLLTDRKSLVYDYREELPYVDVSDLEDAIVDDVTSSVLDEFTGGRGTDE